MDTYSSSNDQTCGGQPSLHPPGSSSTTSSSCLRFPDLACPMMPYHSPAPSKEPTTTDHNNRHLGSIILPSCPRGPVNLPSFEDMADPQSIWVTLDRTACVSVMSDCCDVAEPNLCRLPTGWVGELLIKDFLDLSPIMPTGCPLNQLPLKQPSSSLI